MVLRVLVVDSDLESAQRLAEQIRAWGHEPHIAPTASAAIEVARAVRPRIALVDPTLPEAGGLELARRLRERTVFVAVTSCTKRPYLRQCLRAGYVLHLLKPVDPGLLRPVLDAVRRPSAIPAKATVTAGAADMAVPGVGVRRSWKLLRFCRWAGALLRA
jgi:CheY-like chemotaxis protein